MYTRYYLLSRESSIINIFHRYYLTSFEAAVEYIATGELEVQQLYYIPFIYLFICLLFQKNVGRDFRKPKIPDDSGMDEIGKANMSILNSFFQVSIKSTFSLRPLIFLTLSFSVSLCLSLFVGLSLSLSLSLSLFRVFVLVILKRFKKLY